MQGLNKITALFHQIFYMLSYKHWLANSIGYKIVRFYLNKKSLRHSPNQHELLENEISGAQVKLFKFYF